MGEQIVKEGFLQRRIYDRSTAHRSIPLTPTSPTIRIWDFRNQYLFSSKNQIQVASFGNNRTIHLDFDLAERTVCAYKGENKVDIDPTNLLKVNIEALSIERKFEFEDRAVVVLRLKMDVNDARIDV